MENKHKLFIAAVTLALIFVLFACWYQKPKKYVKKEFRNVPEDPKPEATEQTEVVAAPATEQTEVVAAPAPEQTVIETITAEECAERLYNAMLGHGTDTRAVLQCFDFIDNNEEFDEVMEAFAEQYGEEFDAVLGREMFSSKILANRINEMLATKGIDRFIEII